MEILYQIREIIIAFTKRYDAIISFALRFFSGIFIYSVIMGIGNYNLAFAAMSDLGFMFTSFMGLLFAILPLSASYVIMILVTVVQFSAQLEIAIIVFIGLATMFLFYGHFGKRESVLVIAMLMGFHFNMPFIVPIIAGMYFGLTSIIPMSIASLIFSYSHLIFGILDYENGAAVGLNLDMITDMEIEDLFSSFMQLYDSFSLDSTPVQSWIFLTVAIFVVFIFVYIVSRLPINYGKELAIGLATIMNLFAFIFISFFVELGIGIGMIIFMSILSSAIMIVYNFFKSALVYSSAGRVEFSDEDFYYYVKYIPKIKTTNPAPFQNGFFSKKQNIENDSDFEDDLDDHTYRPRTREDYRRETATTYENDYDDEDDDDEYYEETPIKSKRFSPRSMFTLPIKKR